MKLADVLERFMAPELSFREWVAQDWRWVPFLLAWAGLILAVTALLIS